jgi:2-succinyl-5-enolpyruvyl-6-hydroxy-3-cyclohexene-1-carboxylate synthase
MTNRNTLYAEIFVDELARAGLKHVCLAPGSRNTPLVLAFAKHKSIKCYSHLDERSMAFFALGIALALDEPVAIVCTSGSAAANFFPAIVEAHESRVPLLVLTADRPPELRHSGANQTIDQVKMFGDYALWFVDAALPEAQPPALAIRNLRALAHRAIATLYGLRKGVVHINLPLRKPLEPIPVATDAAEPPPDSDLNVIGYAQINPLLTASDAVLRWFAHIVEGRTGIIVCGVRSPRHFFEQEMFNLATKIGYPVITDSTSGLRFVEDASIAGYDSYLSKAAWADPEVVIRFGDMPTSQALNDYLNRINAKYRIHVTKSGVWSDDSHRTNSLLQADEGDLCQRLTEVVKQQQPAWVTQIQQAEKTTWETITHEIENGVYFDGAAVYDVVDLIPDESVLFVGNSLAVRHLDQFGKPNGKRIRVYANRGASGIDGNISTALGAGAAHPDHPLVAIVGDITLYHDMNGLLAVHRCGVPVTLVLLNNNGGGIFHRLPIKDFDPEFTEFFITPHGLDFSHAAKLYGMEYIQVTEREAFRQAFTASVTQRTSAIIEVQTDGKADLQRRNAIVAAVQARLKEQTQE